MEIEEIKKHKTIKQLLEFGIINIDKPSGPTSFKVSEKVKLMLGLRKTSHFGTLDPKVTGVLPVALNRACKLTGHFLGEDKEYIGIMRIHEDMELKEIEKTIKKKFTGVIIQKPPVKSRVKRQERPREIKKFELLEKNKKDILFRAEVQGGTYIRKLLDDLGKELGIGAHMLELRRVRAGIFKEDDEKYPVVNLYDLEKAVEAHENGNETLLRGIIIPGEIITELHPVVEIQRESMGRILHGQPIYDKDLINPVKIKKGKKISVFSGLQFVGVFKIINATNIFAKSEFTFQGIKI